MKKELIVPTTKEIKEKWESFGLEYTNKIEGASVEAGEKFFMIIIKLMKELKMDSQQNLHFGEIACGSGVFIEHVISVCPQSYFNIDLYDLSEYMISKTKERLNNLSGHYPIALKENDFSDNSFNLRIFNQNAESLHQIPSNYYDILIGNLVIHLVEKPECVVKEIERVVKPNGIGYFSVLSDFANSTVFNSVINIVTKYGFKPFNFRTIFHLEKDEDLMNLFKSDKLKILRIENVNIKFEDVNKGMFNMPIDYYKEFINTLPEDKQKALYKEYDTMINQYKNKEKDLNYYVKAIFYQKVE